MRLVAPMTEVGFTALSVEMNVKCSTPKASAARTTFNVPKTLFSMASRGHTSMSGTCLWAAAWNTTAGRYFSNTSFTRASLQMLPISMSIAMSS